MSDVWFAIPSANPDNCRRTLPAWRERGYKVAVLQNRVRADIPADLVVWSDHYPGWADSINILSRSIVPKDCPVLVSGGDDMLPDESRSAGQLLNEFLERFPTTFGVMQPHGDTFMDAPRYCGSPWLGRAWRERMYNGNGPMHPGYRHNWADNELYWVARGLGVLWSRPDVSQFHAHFTRAGEAPPAYWTSEVEHHDGPDARLFLARAWQHFPGHEPVWDARAMGGPAPTFDRGLYAAEGGGRSETLWLVKHGLAAIRGSGEQRFRAAMEMLAREGCTRVAVFGAGTHTRALALALAQPRVPIVCVIDDHPDWSGRRLWNYPVVPASRAQEFAPQAVILSSDTRERDLLRAARPLAAAGVRVVPLYTDERAAREILSGDGSGLVGLNREIPEPVSR